MFGVSRKDSGGEDECSSDLMSERTAGPPPSQDTNSSAEDDTDSWEDAFLNAPSALVLGTMHDYRVAVRKSGSAAGGAWAKATATKREMDEDVGFCAMKDLLDEAMYSSDKERFVGEQYECRRRGLSDGNADVDPSMGAQVGPAILRTNDSQVQVGGVGNVGDIFRGDSMASDVILRMCPCWKENMEFLETVTDREDLKGALHEVIRGKKQVEEMFDEIDEAFSCRERALGGD